MDLQLEGKVYLISGGASGIGAAIAWELAREKAVPVILDRADPTTAKVFEGNKDITAAIQYFQLDLCDDVAVKSAVEAIYDKNGQIDGIINNAGINDNVGLESSVADFESSLRKNLIHAYSLVHHSLPHLKQAKGSIVNIGSKVFTTGQGGTSGYAAAKGGLAGLTREWALDLAPHSIRSNAVIPAEVWTPMYDAWLQKQGDPNALKKEIEDRIPLEKRFTTVEEIAAMCVFLLSPQSSHTTGQIIHVDGGYTHLDRAFDR